MFKVAAVAFATILLSVATADARDGARHNHSKQCSEGGWSNPDMLSLRCRMQAPKPAGEKTVYIFMGHKWIHVSSGQ